MCVDPVFSTCPPACKLHTDWTDQSWLQHWSKYTLVGHTTELYGSYHRTIVSLWKLAGRNLYQWHLKVEKFCIKMSTSRRPEGTAGASTLVPSPISCWFQPDLLGGHQNCFICMQYLGLHSCTACMRVPLGFCLDTLWKQPCSCLAERHWQVLEKGCFSFWLKQQSFWFQSWQ